MNKKLDRNYYDILEIERASDDAVIKKAYKKAALVHHPDKGGSDDMFQQVHEAFQVLSDPVKRSDYDKDLKKYNLKDGMGKPANKTKSGFNHQNTQKTQENFAKQEPEYEKPKFSKQHSFVEIPANLSTLGIKELKLLMDGLGIKHDDCFEKNEMIARVNEYKDNKKFKKEQEQQPPPRKQESTTNARAAPTQNKENKKPSTTQAPTFSGTYSCMPVPEQVAFKIISVGNSEVGKSCLIKRYCEEKFVERYIQTIGIDYGVKKLKIKGQQIAINFFDMSGNEDYKPIRTEFYPDASGIIMVFDLDNRDSYNSLVHWEDEMKKNGIDVNRVKIVVCGNKADSKGREVNSKEAQKWAKNKGYEYFETSAQSGMNVSDAFQALFEQCYQQFLNDKKTFGL